MAKGKMTMREFEKSSMDKEMDKKLRKRGVKEGSKKDQAMDKKALAKYNKGKK